MLDYTFFRENLVSKTEQWHQSDREENYEESIVRMTKKYLEETKAKSSISIPKS